MRRSASRCKLVADTSQKAPCTCSSAQCDATLPCPLEAMNHPLSCPGGLAFSSAYEKARRWMQIQEGPCQSLFTSLVMFPAEASLEHGYLWEDASAGFTHQLLTSAYLPLRPGTRTATGGSAAATTSWWSCAAARPRRSAPSPTGATACTRSPIARSAPASTSSTSAQVCREYSLKWPERCRHGWSIFVPACAVNWGREDRREVCSALPLTCLPCRGCSSVQGVFSSVDCDHQKYGESCANANYLSSFALQAPASWSPSRRTIFACYQLSRSRARLASSATAAAALSLGWRLRSAWRPRTSSATGAQLTLVEASATTPVRLVMPLMCSALLACMVMTTEGHCTLGNGHVVQHGSTSKHLEDVRPPGAVLRHMM